MSKKRTKKQKIRAQYHYALPVARSFSGIKPSTDEKNKVVTQIYEKYGDVSSLYAYDPYFTRLDIRRTMIISLVILVAQLALYYWWK